MKRGHSLFPVVLAGFLAATTLWLEQFVSSQAVAPDGKHRHDPDMIAEGAIQERFDASGRRQYVLEARRLVHYPDDDTSELEGVKLTHFGREQPLHLVADHGKVGPAGRTVVLSGGVKGNREARADLPAASFTTSEITVFPDDERAETDKPVHMTRGRSELDGVGLSLDNINGVAVIGSVRATLYPRSQDSAR